MRVGWCRAAALVASVVALGGCSARLAGGLNEAQANDILAALDAHGIGADKREESAAGREVRFDVVVAASDVGEALRVLGAAGLPRRDDPGVQETYARSGLVPSPTEERARWLAALGGEIASTLERIDGVVDARVHVAVPDVHDVPLDAAPPPARASVLVKLRPGARLDVAAVQRLVAGAVDGLDPSAVSVVESRASATPSSRAGLVHVGPLRVAPGSATPLRIALLASLALHVALAALLVVVVRRGREAVA